MSTGRPQDSHLADTYAAYLRLEFPRGLTSPSPQDDEVLGDLQIDLDLEGGELVADVENWIKHRRAPDAVKIDKTIDERLTHEILDQLDLQARNRARSCRAGQWALARALQAATGVPIRHRPWHED
jgi:hypothetical protein